MANEIIKQIKLGNSTYDINEAAGANLGLVKTGGDVNISGGVISINDNTMGSVETIQKNIVISPSALSVNASLLNDATFENVQISGTPIVKKLNVYGATYKQEAYDWELSPIHIAPGQSFEQLVPYSEFFPYDSFTGGQITTDITFDKIQIIRHSDNLDITDHKDTEFREFTTDEGYRGLEITFFNQTLDIFFTNDGILFEGYTSYDGTTSTLSLFLFDFTCTVTDVTVGFSIDSVSLNSFSGNSLNATFNPNKDKELFGRYITNFDYAVAEVQYNVKMGGNLNAGNKYPYFPYLATENLTPVSGSVIRPSIDAEYDFGSTDKKWHNVYAHNFNGTATRAIQDVNGRDIINTYATKSELSQSGKGPNTTYTLTKQDSTITLTGSDGSTTSVEDTNTTYSLATAGAAGLMPALTNNENQFLCGNGTWKTVNNAEEATF